MMNRRGNWSVPGIPHKGWECVGFYDLGSITGKCGMCGGQNIRYVHVMSHPDYPGTLECGCVCAEHMADGYNGKDNEAVLRKAARRIKTQLKNWRTKHNGTQHKPYGDYYMIVFEKSGIWTPMIKYPSDRIKPKCLQSYNTVDEAKLAALTFVDGIMRSHHGTAQLRGPHG